MQTLMHNPGRHPGQHFVPPGISPFVDFNLPALVRDDGVRASRAAYLRQADTEFVQMLDGFRASGGLARLQEVAQRCERCGGPDIATISACLARREIICFEWQSQFWMPLFQFDLLDMTIRPQLQPIVAELSCIYTSWDLAFWFSQPNPWLADRAPADALVTDLPTVLQAARAGRFIAN